MFNKINTFRAQYLVYIKVKNTKKKLEKSSILINMN